MFYDKVACLRINIKLPHAPKGISMQYRSFGRAKLGLYYRGFITRDVWFSTRLHSPSRHLKTAVIR